MATKINPPSLKSKNYELYKQELLAWREITVLEKKKQGVAIALSLPEDHEIREKVFDQLSLEDLKKEDGLQTLITFLDCHLAKDDLTDSLEKFEEFDDYQRLDSQSISDFVANFDAKYRKIAKKNMKLPSEILAFKLLRKANITKEEKMLVLTGMNYDNKDALYEEAKKSLKKFKGDTLEGSKSESVSIKLEPAFLAQHEDALLAAGYTSSKPAFSGYNKYGNQRGRGYYRGGSQSGKEQCVSKKINPVGLNGRPMICKSCGSYRHLLDDCPDSWENMAKVNVTEEEENVVLFTGYNKTDILRLGIDARNCAVLDSACSSTVCGESWLKEYMSSLDENIKGRVIQKEGNRVFKFGGGTKLKSKGEFTLPAIMAGKNVQIKTDIVESDIPLLLSRSAMKSAGVKLDLENDTANIFGKDVMLNLTNSGH